MITTDYIPLRRVGNHESFSEANLVITLKPDEKQDTTEFQSTSIQNTINYKEKMCKSTVEWQTPP